MASATRGPRKRTSAKRPAVKKATGTRPPDPEADVERKRVHRRSLSEKGAKKWGEAGEDAKRAYMESVRKALEAEGFQSTRLQWRHKGHAFGLVKDAGRMQVHVRVYDDGVIDAEIEIHKRYMQHLWSPRPSAHEEVQQILQRHGIDTDLINEQYLPQVGALRERFPERLVRVTTVAGSTAAVVGGAVVYSLARMYVKRKK
jgi:hypothetical protein